MSIKWKIIASVMLIIMAITAVFIFSFLQFSKKYITQHIDIITKNVHNVSQSIEQTQQNAYSKRIKSFANSTTSPSRDKLIRAFARRDRADLLQRTTPFFQLFKKENTYFTTLAWLTPDNHNFLRTHYPQKFDDNVAAMRPDVVAANRSETQCGGYVVAGPGLIYSIVQPISYKGKHIGLVQFGIKVDFLLDAVFKSLQAPIGLLVTNDLYQYAKFSTLPALTEKSYTIESKNLPFFKQVADQIDWTLSRQKVYIQDRTFMIVKVLNLPDFSGKVQGTLIAALDITELLAETKQLTVLIVILGSLLLITSFLILYFSFGFLLGKITRLHQTLEQNNNKLLKRTHQLQQERNMFMNGSVMTYLRKNSKNRPMEHVSSSVSDILGYSGDELTAGTVLYDNLIHPDDRQRVNDEITRGSERTENFFIHEPYRLLTRSGRTVWVLDTTTLIRNRQNKISHFQGYLVDITTTVQMKEKVLETKNRLEFIINAARLGTWDWNILTREQIFNKRCADMLGVTAAELKENAENWQNYIHPDDTGKVNQAIADHFAGKTLLCMSEYRFRHQSGKWVWVLGVGKIIERDKNGKPLRMVGLIFDITDRKVQEAIRLDTAMEQEQLKKLESLKNMAGAIAHRFNNAMMAVEGNLDMVRTSLAQDSKEHKMASQALQAARGASQVGSMMLTYVGQRPLQLQQKNLVDIARESVADCRVLVTPSISLEFTPADVPLSCSMDKKQIKEVMGNIISNAIESLQDSSGTIEIDFITAFYEASSLPIPFQDAMLKDSQYAVCRIRDNGHGIDPESLHRIFEPFYTTRFVGRGIGLALAVGIMKAHHGALTVASIPDQGTTVSLLLPYTPVSRPATSSAPNRNRADGQLSGNILLADDEKMLLKVGKKMFETLGLTVHTAADGQEAVAIIRSRAINFSAVVLNISMPNMNGIEAMEKIRETAPSLPIILSSGFPQNNFSFREEPMGKPDGFLSKPFQISDIRSCLERFLE